MFLTIRSGEGIHFNHELERLHSYNLALSELLAHPVANGASSVTTVDEFSVMDVSFEQRFTSCHTFSGEDDISAVRWLKDAWGYLRMLRVLFSISEPITPIKVKVRFLPYTDEFPS